MDPRLLAACAEIVAVDDAKTEHMTKYPEWWIEDSAVTFADENLDRQPNKEWRALIERNSAAQVALLDAARAVIAEQKKEAA